MILIVISGVFSLSESLVMPHLIVASVSNRESNIQTNYSGSSNSTKVDKFGTKELYPTKMDGKEWSSKWDNGKHRAFFSEESDPYDNEFKLRGDGKIVIDGNGLASLSGSAPRMFVYDELKRNKYNNVEVTFYGKRIAETATLS